MRESKFMKYFLLAGIVLLLLVTTYNCHSPTGPKGNGQDTTSHAFTWQTYVLGDGGASTLYGAAIINDTLIYVVGDIEKMDSTGQFEMYNLATWNGQNWKLRKVPYIYQGQPFYGQIPWIYALNAKDIWFGNSVHWDGQHFSNVDIGISIFSGIGSNKMWASSAGQFYVVGKQGTIAYSPDHGNSWQKLSSGTTTDIHDVWGIEGVVYCAVSNTFDPNAEKKILKITNEDKVDSLKWLGRSVGSVWTPDGKHLYTAGDGVFENDGSGWKEMVTGASIFTSSIRGNDNNDLVVVGGFGFIAHWNGKDFKIYPPNGDIIYKALAMKGNTVVAVGTTGEDAVVTIGKREH